MPDPRRIARTIATVTDIRPSGPLAMADLVQAGLSRGQIRAAVQAGRLLPLRRGLFVPEALWSAADADQRHAIRCQTALRAFTGSFVSHQSAARVHGLPTMSMDDTDGPIAHITLPGLSRADEWIRIHGRDAPPVGIIQGPLGPMTNLATTSIELASTRSLRRAAVFIDAAMRQAISQDLVTTDLRNAVRDPRRRAATATLWRTALEPYRGHRWVTRVRRAIEIGEPASESPLESMSRVEIIESGLPSPRCGVPIVGDDGLTYWVDMVWDHCRLIGEVDGMTKYADRDALLQEKRRQEALMGAGWRFVRWGWPQAVTDPSIMINRIRRALAE